MTTLKPDNLARFHSSRPYNFFDPQILALHEERYALVRALNATTDLESREKAAKALFKAFGEGCVLALPIWVEWVSRSLSWIDSFG